MNIDTLVLETMRLEIATIESLSAIGCLHAYQDQTGFVQVEVPPEEAHYDPSNGLVWVMLNPQRLPRPYTYESLLAAGFQEAVAERFGFPVETWLQGENIAVMSWLARTVRPETELRQPISLAV